MQNRQQQQQQQQWWFGLGPQSQRDGQVGRSSGGVSTNEVHNNSKNNDQQQQQQHNVDNLRTIGDVTHRASSTIEDSTLQHINNPDEVMSMLAKDLYSLNFQEREAVYDDIHGTTGPGEPTTLQKVVTSSATTVVKKSKITTTTGEPAKNESQSAGVSWSTSIPANDRGGGTDRYSSDSSPPGSPISSTSSGRPLTPSPDDPTMVDEKLVELQRYVDSIHPKRAYDMAFQMDPEYVMSHSLRLMILRARRFDVKESGKLLVHFFAGKLDLFGPQTLTRSLRWTDLDQDDVEYIRHGYLQVLPSRDSAGRIVLVDTHLISHVKYKTPKSAARSIVYLFLSLVENDEDVQKRGVVVIGYAINSSLTEIDPGMNAAGTLVVDMTPIRFVCWHVCLGAETWFRRLQANMVRILRLHDRLRVRCHEGSRTEILYYLMSFGIRVNDFPVSEDGIVTTTEHEKWLMMQQRKEEVYDMIRPIQLQMNQAIDQTHIPQNLSNSFHNQQQISQQVPFLPVQQSSEVLYQQFNGPAHTVHPDVYYAPSSNLLAASTSSINVPAQAVDQNSLDVRIPMSGLVEVPSARDVVVGRGQVFQNHPGNVHMRKIIRKHMEEHQSTNSRKAKTDLAKRIVGQIQQEYGGRFLQRDTQSGWWTVIPDEQARKKVSMAFRTMKFRDKMHDGGTTNKNEGSSIDDHDQKPATNTTTKGQLTLNTDEGTIGDQTPVVLGREIYQSEDGSSIFDSRKRKYPNDSSRGGGCW